MSHIVGSASAFKTNQE